MDSLSKYPHLRRYVDNLQLIPSGTYRWGASPVGKIPGTRVSMSSFKMGATLVTWGIWKEYSRSISAKLPSDPGWGYPDNHPVVKVSWDDIMNPGGFCEWASDIAKVKLTLPTDAQWEYAARGGKDGLEFPWGNTFERNRVWCSTSMGDAGKTAAVNRQTRIYKNGYNLTDMVGNVWQWCSDYYNEGHSPKGKDPVDSQLSSRRRVRGGCWFDEGSISFRCASNGGADRFDAHNFNGFRLCSSVS